MGITYLKIIITEIKKSFGRFMAIFGIVTLGVGFLTGLLVTTPDMHYSVDEYYDQYNMSDMVIKSTMGITEDDLEEVASLESIKTMMPANVTDTLMTRDKGETVTTRIYGLPLISQKVTINQLELLEGRMPRNNNECLVEQKGGYITYLPIGTKLKISEENKDYDHIDDIYKTLEYKVVGIVSNSYYFSMEKEQTSAGSGKLNAIIYADESAYNLDTYTDLYMTAKGALEKDTFTKEYEDQMKALVSTLETMGKERSQIRYEDIKIQGNDTLEEGKEEYQKTKEESKSQLDMAKTQIIKGKEELNKAYFEILMGNNQLKEARDQLEKSTSEAQKELEISKKQLESAKKELEEGEKNLRLAKLKLEKGEKEYKVGLTEYISGKTQLDLAEKELKKNEEAYKSGLKQLNNGKSEISLGESRLSRSETELNEGERQYQAGLAETQRQKLQIEAIITPLLPISGFSTTDALLTAISKGNTDAANALDAILSNYPNLGYPVINSNTLAFGWNQIKEAEEKLRISRIELDQGRLELNRGWSELNRSKYQIEASEKELVKSKKLLDAYKEKLILSRNELDQGYSKLEKAKKEIQQGRAEYEKGTKKIESGWTEYEKGLEQLKNGEITLKSGKASALKVISQKEEKLNQGMLSYKQGLEEWEKAQEKYKKAKAEATRELEKAWEEIEEGEEKLDDLETPKWYILDRNQNMSYVSFLMNAEKVSAVSKVFPIFFYIIAALVALTTMTRMVEEERTQIGTLKALGYTKSVIMLKYLVYCGLSSILGSIVGTFIGLKIIPYIIWNAYGTMYHLPKFFAEFNPKIVFSASSLAILSTTAATIYAVSSSLKEKPSQLMQARAPKAGKRILLERITPLWSVMSFNHKATARNLFRYKKHFLMTIIGVGGCTALLMAGFGLRDSIGTIINSQFAEIYNYDILIDLDKDKAYDQDLDKILKDKEKIQDYMSLFKEESQIITADEVYDTTVFVPEEKERINDFLDLRNRKTKKKIQLDDSSVVITEKIAEVLNLDIGDSITLENDDKVKASFVVGGITENYIGNFIYMTRTSYKNQFKDSLSNNAYLAKSPYEDPVEQDELASELLSVKNVFNAEFIINNKKMFDNLLYSINYIVIVIIVASGILAFIVLYNLTNININERKKELATLKVLGFYDEEVSAYIFRETVILTFMGIAFGLVFGRILHSFIISVIEDIDFMFGRKIFLVSYFMSALVTLLFSLIVNLFMSRKIKSIQMVDSMKAID